MAPRSATLCLLAVACGGAPADHGESEPLVGRTEADGFGSLGKMRSIAQPTLLIHGEADRIIDVSEARSLVAASAATNKRLVVIPGAGHNNLIAVARDEYFGAISELVGN